MKNKCLKFFNQILAFGCITFLFFSCNNDDNHDDSGKYPKRVSIEYKLTSTTAVTANVQYRNETGGMTSLDNQTLPFSKTITREVNKFEDASVGYGANQSATVKMDILVNGILVKTQTNTSSTGALVYLFE
ncbi:hypothetical protein [Flavobacterium sp. UMI-01]|uniref:hypothetical protein n=1 Tax=Flavobacterium sp. UMI-01 TaxID=1441053 RepID=UPI001C7D77BB|nr:hypothetical protein [Flavobacterium sp. UMI-01]GIZ07754.1 hypothetical protein FUMI01_04810 [Flavobacterium sp. UMI-01]